MQTENDMSEEEGKLTDREMLAIAYGALMANPKSDRDLLCMIRKQLFPGENE